MEELYKVSLSGDVKALTDWRARNSQLPLHVKFTAYQRTPLHIAAMCGHIKFAEELLRIDSRLVMKIDSSGFTPLHLASARKSVSMVKTLLMTNEDVCMVRDQDGRTPLHLAAMKDRMEIIDVLYKKKPEAIHIRINGQHETILHLCIRNNSLSALDLLICHLQSEGAQSENMDDISVNSTNDEGNTILHLAADKRQMECFRFLMETKGIGVETNALNNNDLKARDLLTQTERDALEIGCYNMNKEPKATDQKKKEEQKASTKWLIERVNALMVVATLIAGITFQATMNPPGGVFQEDSTIKATESPVRFSYYLGSVIGTDMSADFNSYIDFLSKLPSLLTKFEPSFVINMTALQNITLRNTTSVTSANFVKELLHNLYSESQQYYNPYSLSKSPGIVIEHDKLNAIITKYNEDPRFFSPYLIRYAGTPILAYRYPVVYGIYMLSTAIAFTLSLCIILLVISGFISEVYLNQQVRVLVGMMILSTLGWLISYIVVFVTMSPPFYVNQPFLLWAFGTSYIVICLGVGPGMWFYQKILRKYWVQYSIKKYTAKNEILVDQFKEEDRSSFIQMPGFVTKVTLVLYALLPIISFGLPFLIGYLNCTTCNKDQKKYVTEKVLV